MGDKKYKEIFQIMETNLSNFLSQVSIPETEGKVTGKHFVYMSEIMKSLNGCILSNLLILKKTFSSSLSKL